MKKIKKKGKRKIKLFMDRVEPVFLGGVCLTLTLKTFFHSL